MITNTLPHQITTLHRIILLCCAFGTTIVMSSCTTYQRAIPPSTQQPDSKRSPTQKPYIVNGKRYEPLSSHHGFEQEGIASSYGSEFHGRNTSNGERFDMNSMTAAHKTLPMGVYVQVDHKRNGRQVIVRINDRGPFVAGRIIDLSESAAGKLGMLQEGVAPVKVTALGYRNSSSTGYRQLNDYDSGTFSLQVAAFTIRSNAYRYADELKRKFGTSEVQEAQVGGKTFYRVRVGRYSSLRAAQASQNHYEQSGFPDCYVVAVD